MSPKARFECFLMLGGFYLALRRFDNRGAGKSLAGIHQ